MKILVTGVAGFIGFHLTKKLLDNGHTVLGVDNLNKYYEIKLKKDRLNFLKRYKKRFLFFKGDIARQEFLNKFKKKKFSIIINLAAQAGVRYSIKNPYEYAKSNLVGFVNIIELAKIKKIKHFLYASSSSVYGYSKKKYYKEDDPVDHPMQLYAATKRSNELIAHAYSSLFDLPVTGLRFFTVFGEYGRPDMFIFKLLRCAFKKEVFQLNNFGNHKTNNRTKSNGFIRLI